MGVRLFFVLSGLLITGILLRSRDAADHAHAKRLSHLLRFYARYCLRIFPLYYFVIAVGVALNMEAAREYIFWLLTYTLNIKMAHQGWYIANFAHFWTLAVEEQFYLAWPWIVFFLPRKWLVGAAIVMLSAGPLYRLYHVIGWAYFNSEATGLRTYMSTFTCLDSLGMGALLAVLTHDAHCPRKLCRRFAVTFLPIGVSTYIGFAVIERVNGHGELGMVFSNVSLSMIYLWLVYAAAVGFGGILGRFLQLKPLTYIGKISYGIYVYHPFVPGMMLLVFERLGWPYPTSPWIGFAMLAFVTLIVSSISWYLFESPINNLKRYLPADPK